MITGRCYCGAVSIKAAALPQTATYCHCVDCRRVTGAPVTAFAAFARGEVTLSGGPVSHISQSEGVERWFCTGCGSPLKARFAYLPDQTYVPLGVLDQADDMAPSLHCYAQSGMPWLIIQDDLPRVTDSGADVLQGAADG